MRCPDATTKPNCLLPLSFHFVRSSTCLCYRRPLETSTVKLQKESLRQGRFGHQDCVLSAGFSGIQGFRARVQSAPRPCSQSSSPGPCCELLGNKPPKKALPSSSRAFPCRCLLARRQTASIPDHSFRTVSHCNLHQVKQAFLQERASNQTKAYKMS